MKGKLLAILKNSPEVVSGEVLSRALKISRVAVWKHIQKLTELGYDIQAAAKGYYLRNDPDLLHPWEFPGREALVHYYPQVQSTMMEARKLARENCPPFTTVVADEQTDGRGRLKRTWISESGGLYFTIIARPQLPPGDMAQPLFAASLSLVEALESLYGLPVGVKWPNDLLIHGKKIAGILAEMEAESDVIRYLNIGVGVNINNHPALETSEAASVLTETGRIASRKLVLAEFMERFEARLTQGLAQAIPAWKTRSVTLGKRVRIVTVKETIEGTALDVDEAGALIVRLDDGGLRSIIHGDCFHQPQAEPAPAAVKGISQ